MAERMNRKWGAVGDQTRSTAIVRSIDYDSYEGAWQGIARALGEEQAYRFESAARIYDEVAHHFPGTEPGEKARLRLPKIDALIAEKAIYTQIDQAARDVLTQVGIDLSQSPQLLDLLMEAEAVDYENDRAVFVPLNKGYIEHCLDLVPRSFTADRGLNAFGTGGTPSFLKRRGENDLRPADGKEFEKIVQVASTWTDVVDIFSVPALTDGSTDDYECAKVMARWFKGLKMISTVKMSDEQLRFLSGNEDWLDGTSLMSCLKPMPNMVRPFLRSAAAGNQILLLDLTIAGVSGPITPQALLTLIHAHVLFMMVVAQTVHPGVTCVHGGIPGVVDRTGDLSYSSPSQPLINAALARLNLWVTGYPSAQSGGSTSVCDNLEAAVNESEVSRNTMRKYGAHFVRHALGAMGNLNFFSLEKFILDCEKERTARQSLQSNSDDGFIRPLYLSGDPEAAEAVREMALKGNPRYTDHCLRNIGAFEAWPDRIREMEARPAD